MADFYPLKASTDFKVLLSIAQESLAELGFSFIVNKTERLVEFEVSTPAYFRVVIERRSDPQIRNVMMIIPPSISSAKGSTIEVRFGLDENPSSLSVAESSARSFLRSLVAKLPAKPWQGLGFRETRREKKLWIDATQTEF